MRTPQASTQRVGVSATTEVNCSHCQGVLDRHQPDSDQPSRLLGTCPDCGLWHLIDAAAGTVLRIVHDWSTAEPDFN
ncbi:MAG: hypothetical protein U0835_24860 [Isosphaeraceae bacterium]